MVQSTPSILQCLIRCALGTILSVLLLPDLYAANFSHSPLSAVYKASLKSAGLWKKSCPVSLEQLSDVRVSYYDLEGEVHHDGRLIVLDVVASDVIDVFKTLYKQQFPIHKMIPTSEYGGDDNLSLQANNTSAYNCRAITGGGLPSLHAFGLAIDVNTVQNPYIHLNESSGTADVMPPAGLQYLNRHHIRAGMVEPIVKHFKRAGFGVWGGDWNTPIDYQHFQTTRFVAKMLAALPRKDAKQFYQINKRHFDTIKKLQAQHFMTIKALYDKNPKRFLVIFKRYADYLKTHTAEQFISKLSTKLA